MPVRFEFSWFGERDKLDRPATGFDVGAVAMQLGGVYVDLYGEYRVNDGSAYHLTGVYATFGAWNNVEYIVTPGADLGGYYSVTIDAYLSINDGPKMALIEGLAGTALILNSEYNNPRMMLLMDAPLDSISATVYFDDILIEKIPEPGTLMLLGLGALTLSRKRKLA